MCLFKKIVLHFTFLFTTTICAQTYTIKGKIVDDKTQQPIEFANVYLKKALVGGMANENGEFVLQTTVLPDTLRISFIGYNTIKLYLVEEPKSKLTFKLSENISLLSEVEVVNYKDPGKHIMQEVIANKSKNDLKRFNNSVFNEYRKTEIDVFNLDTTKSKGFFKNIAEIYNTYSGDSTTNVAPIFFTEKFFRTYHSNNLQTNIEHEIARKELGLSTDKLGVKLEKFEFKINIYDGIIPILKTSFLSPVSALGLLYYKFNPLDTITDGDKQYIKLEMKPKVKNENTFTGIIWVEDGSFAITHYDLKTTKGSNINFINSIAIQGNYVSISNKVEAKANVWVPKTYKTNIEFSNGLDIIGIPIQGDSTSKKVRLLSSSVFGDYVVNSENLNANNFYNTSKTTDSFSVKINPISQFDDIYRLEQLTDKEKAIYKAIDSLKTNKKFVRETKLTSFIATGYWDFGCKLRIGPYSSLLSTNLIEGLRTRSGFWTLPCVSKTFNFNGYIAYGFKDKVTKGGLGIKYVPTTKQYMKTELFARSDYDALQDYDDELDNDNLFTLALRKNVPAFQVFIQQVKFLQEIDLNKDWSVKAYIAIKTLTPSFEYKYYKLIDDKIVDFTPLKKINVNETGITFRYAHNERTTIFNYDRIRISSPYPTFSFNYTYGFEGTKNTFFEYHKLVANITQELILPIKGSVFYSLSAGQMFGVAPAILLFAPTGNAYYVANKHTFNNMLPYEFAADRYASIMIRYNMGGIILDKIPLINKLKLRERVIFNNYWGTMSKENRAFNNINPIKTTGAEPYSEAGVGIGHIFNVLSLDAIWRISQFNNQQAYTRFGIYTTLTLVF